jgi:4-hydroxy-tetrahydrodipicolinate synthase
MKTPVFTGSAVALVTPFDGDFIDFDKMASLIDWHIESGTSALVICGTTGEASTQSIPEHLATVEYAVKHSAGRLPVIAGTGSNDTAHALMMSQAAEKSGADALMLVTPYYNKTSQNGLIKHFMTIADRVHSPIILYNVPSRTGMSFTPETYKALSAHPNINGIKEAGSNMSLMTRTMALCGDDLNLWSGNDDETVAIMALGGKGVISVAANVVPSVMRDICAAFLNGSVKEALAISLRHQKLFDALFMDVNPIPVKTALKMMGKDPGPLRMPLCDMEDAKTEKLRQVLAEYNLI